MIAGSMMILRDKPWANSPSSMRFLEARIEAMSSHLRGQISFLWDIPVIPVFQKFPKQRIPKKIWMHRISQNMYVFSEILDYRDSPKHIGWQDNFLDVSLHVKVINSYKFQISHFSTYLYFGVVKKNRDTIFKFTWIHSETVRDMGQTLGIKWYAGWCFWFQRGHNLQFSRSSFIDWTRMNIWLVVDLPLWKMMEWKSVGMMKFPIYGKIKFMFHTTKQLLTFLWKMRKVAKKAVTWRNETSRLKSAQMLPHVCSFSGCTVGINCPCKQGTHPPVCGRTLPIV